MQGKRKQQSIDWGQIAGAIIFIIIFISLIVLGLSYTGDSQFDSSFFEDVSNKMRWK